MRDTGRPDSFLPLLKCPACGYHDLLAAGEGVLCPGCSTRYPIVNGIPDLAGHVKPDSVAGRIQQRYEQDASRYAVTMRDWILPLAGSSAEKMIALVESVAHYSECLLDVPVGPGDFNFEVYRNLRPRRVIAVDLAWAMLNQAQQRALELGLTNIFLVRADIERLPFRDSVFDGLVTINGLHSFPDPASALRNMRAVAKPGARIAGSCFVLTEGWAGWLMRMFQKAGNLPETTAESMMAQIQACWPTAEISRSGAILTFKTIADPLADQVSELLFMDTGSPS